MRGRDSKLIDQIERGAVDSSVPLADTLRKCLVLGGQTKSAPLRDWASRELNGYGPDDELPEWRTVVAPILLDGVNGRYQIKSQQISVFDLPNFARERVKEEVSFRGGVGELEAALRQADKGTVRIGLPGGQDLVTYINGTSENRFQVIERLYYGVSTTAIHGILDHIRTALAALVAELRDGMPDGAEVPSQEVATQAAQFIITGKRHRLVVNNAQSSGEGTSTIGAGQDQEPDSRGWKRWARVGGAVVGAAGIIAAVFAVLQYVATP